MIVNTCELLAVIQNARILAYGGHRDEALKIISDIRSQFGIHDNPSVSSEVMIAEGIIMVSAADWNSAYDRFRRAILVGRIHGRSDAPDFASVWSSHCLFNLGRVEDAIDLVLEVLQRFTVGRIELRHRLCVVLAELYAYAGDRDRAADWFDASRILAGRIQSRELFSATLFNMCALRVWESALIPRIFGDLKSDMVTADLVFLKSSVNYDRMTGVSSRLFLHKLLHAQLLIAVGQYHNALDLLDALLSRDGDLGGFEWSRITLERAWCQLEIDDPQTEWTEVRVSILNCIVSLLDDDDLALAHLILSRIGRLTRDAVEISINDAATRRYSELMRRKRESAKLKLLESKIIAPDQLLME
jgi:tetratricopeptide (TPR) repeat protein